MIFSTLGRCRSLLLPKKTDARTIFEWLVIVFNQVDLDRVKACGPDRVCAEWLLRNGAAVKWVGNQDFLSDYNSLPAESTRLQLEKVDASGSSISHHGFLHFRNCTRIDELILHDCGYIEDSALKQISMFLKESIQRLKVSSCGNISAEGLLHLKDLQKLKTLDLQDLYAVKDRENTLKVLKEQLKNCTITTDFEATKQLKTEF